MPIKLGKKWPGAGCGEVSGRDCRTGNKDFPLRLERKKRSGKGKTDNAWARQSTFGWPSGSECPKSAPRSASGH